MASGPLARRLLQHRQQLRLRAAAAGRLRTCTRQALERAAGPSAVLPSTIFVGPQVRGSKKGPRPRTRRPRGSVFTG